MLRASAICIRVSGFQNKTPVWIKAKVLSFLWDSSCVLGCFTSGESIRFRLPQVTLTCCSSFPLCGKSCELSPLFQVWAEEVWPVCVHLPPDPPARDTESLPDRQVRTPPEPTLSPDHGSPQGPVGAVVWFWEQPVRLVQLVSPRASSSCSQLQSGHLTFSPF